MLFKSKDKIEGSYDVIVVGSGLAGMTAANKLAMNGRKVLLLESHNKLGGFATWFKRAQGDHIFDVSLHGFPVGMIKTCRKYWGKEIASKIVQVEKVRYVNPQFEVETDFTKEHFTSVLVEKFEIEKSKVDGFFEELAAMNFYDNNQMNNGELFQKWFPDRNDVVRFLLEPIVYANGSTLEDPAITYGIVFSNFMSKGVYIFRGGTDVLISMMKEELLKNGVDIQMHAKVDKIVIEDGQAKGVEVKGHFIAANSVLSNANIRTTVQKMVGEEHFTSEFVEKTKQVRLNTSSCQVFMGIKKGESLPDIGELIFYSDDSDFNTDLILSPKIGSQTFSVYYPEIRPHLDDRYAVVSSSNARYEDWKNLSEDEYKKQKEFVIERALSTLEKVVPGVREKIDFIDCSTPLTVEKYTHHQKGSSFGTKFEGLEISMGMHQQIKGLFHAGSVGIIMSGWLGAANYGVIQSHEVDNYLDTVTSPSIEGSL
ncbi:MAG: phytoene dehydrogenase [Bdellovibrionales bacterium CG12_big_fil_rev_8_21_14_0_65_38_15]|nr:MAG: phytoene dehydrogenase [Bdellovibrionales bacterium CG22_combo_CG10-13_8_21_14_all_38_13]PIQ55334.1 MAG: phytoene dehydrogenase [Bdellovibrionales bacterium CG12_big_fil_rev_8_21_14_0_65_38_15]PIR28944.1 MAG: phytoene dehydrogenase [Bdellovibrionales bacterium CG11_big_fil_rev_8_21_14_0_20_38_13]